LDPSKFWYLQLFQRINTSKLEKNEKFTNICKEKFESSKNLCRELYVGGLFRTPPKSTLKKKH